jgi:hypothetical protein
MSGSRQVDGGGNNMPPVALRQHGLIAFFANTAQAIEKKRWPSAVMINTLNCQFIQYRVFIQCAEEVTV